MGTLGAYTLERNYMLRAVSDVAEDILKLVQRFENEWFSMK
jgi:hypothetical protein